MGLKASDDDVLAQFRSSNPGATDAQIKQALEQQSGVSWEKAVVTLKKQVVFMKYLANISREQPQPSLEVTPKEISDFYESNKVTLLIRMSKVFVYGNRCLFFVADLENDERLRRFSIGIRDHVLFPIVKERVSRCAKSFRNDKPNFIFSTELVYLE
jgi:hypothetical protein